MDIRFFATNRNPEKLAGQFDRDKRLALWRGGYYFVDMKKYMSYYLGTTDEGEMPKEAVVEDASKSVFGDEFLQRTAIKAVAIFVHGFNVTLHEAGTSFGILATTLSHTESGSRFVSSPTDCDACGEDCGRVAIIGFSWPSNGKVVDYVADQRDATQSAHALANLIARIRCIRPDVRVHVVSHSMGNLVVCEMLRGLVDAQFHPIAPEALEDTYRQVIPQRLVRKTDNSTSTDRFVDRLIMLAPDVERRHVMKSVLQKSTADGRGYHGPYHSGLEHLVGKVYNFYSRHDRALEISNWEKSIRDKGLDVVGVLDGLTLGLFDFLKRNPDHKWEQRLGGTKHPETAPNNMRSRNATEMTGREIGHSDYVDSKEIGEEIARILVGDA